jgi:hypothetical protein
MDIKWCECTDRVLEIGFRLVCTKCEGRVKCDFCTAGVHPAASAPLGILVVADKVVCSNHAWLAARLKTSAIENSN